MRKVPHLLRAFLIYAVSLVADMLSSIGRYGNHTIETNPFARHLDGSFWLGHALLNSALLTVFILVFSYILYVALEHIEKRAATVVAALPWLYYAYGHFLAAVSNIQLKLLYVAVDEGFLQMLRKLIP